MRWSRSRRGIAAQVTVWQPLLRVCWGPAKRLTVYSVPRREKMRQKTFAAALSAAVVALAVTPLAAQPSPVDPWSGLYIGIGGNAGGVIGGEKLVFQDLSATQDLSFGTNMDDTRLIGGVPGPALAGRWHGFGSRRRRQLCE